MSDIRKPVVEDLVRAAVNAWEHPRVDGIEATPAEVNSAALILTARAFRTAVDGTPAKQQLETRSRIEDLIVSLWSEFSPKGRTIH